MPPKKIRLKPDRSFLKSEVWGNNKDHHASVWVESPPFVVNPRAVLTHRVQHVTAYMRGNVVTHHAVHFVCENSCCISPIRGTDIHTALVYDPPKGRLLCERCEYMAKVKKLPTGDHLAGRHVHRGVLIAQQTCCGE